MLAWVKDPRKFSLLINATLGDHGAEEKPAFKNAIKPPPLPGSR